MNDKASFGGSGLVRIGRSVRTTAYKVLGPFDYAFRLVNRLTHYPPLHLRKHVGGTNAGFNGPGYEFAAYLRLLAQLRDDSHVWDIGCGCGMLELALQDLGWRGRLIGTDIHRPCIEWARAHIGDGNHGYSFVHMDIYNPAYWRSGRLNASQWLEGVAHRDFDIVVAKSLFTHMLPDEIDVYLGGIAERLRPGGKALLTFFILSDEQRRLAAQGRNSMAFQPLPAVEGCFVRNPHAPTAAVAYEREFLLDRLGKAGFRVDGCAHHLGTWTGASNGLSFQDIVVAGT